MGIKKDILHAFTMRFHLYKIKENMEIIQPLLSRHNFSVGKKNKQIKQLIVCFSQQANYSSKNLFQKVPVFPTKFEYIHTNHHCRVSYPFLTFDLQYTKGEVANVRDGKHAPILSISHIFQRPYRH